MGQDDRKRSRDTKNSVSPELEDIDLSWDDDESPSSLDLDLGDDEDAFDRVTAIPDIPNELLAQRLMERADADAAHRPKSDPTAATSTSIPTLEFEPQLYDPDHDEPTLKVDPEGLQRTAKEMGEDAQRLSFEFPGSPASTTPQDSGETPRRTSPQVALPSDFPPALGAPVPRPMEAPVPPREPFSPEPPPIRPRTRLPTSELILDLDNPLAPGSALELAENAPVVEHEAGPDPLEFELRRTEQETPKAEKDSAHPDMRDRYAMGDFTGALVIAEAILESDPDQVDAKNCAQRCREVLTQMYSARLGPLSQTVAVAIPNDEIRWLSLDHRAGFLLSLVDGSLTLEEILDISGMSKLDALRLMYTLYDQRVITLQ